MREYFLDRIFGEYQAYRASVLGCPNTEIFGRCYEIDITVNIYEILVEKAEKLPDDILAALMKHRNILRDLYDLWLKKEDGAYQELEDYVSDEIKGMAVAADAMPERS
ncbi:MAG: DUF3848 domain-containing protein [Lachnospiraceae bacterium]|nr:DUF3848 domain-containing protein [Lachnospiraceae bacterium]